MLRILVLTNMYPPHHLGGYELSCRDVVERWRARGHVVEVLTTTMQVSGVPNDSQEQGVHRDLVMYWDDYQVVTPSLREQIGIERANQRALDDTIRTFRPDVVSVWHMSSMSFGLLQTITERNLPMVLVVCDDWLVYGAQTDQWSKRFVSRPRLGSVMRRLTGLPTRLALDRDAVAVCFVSDWIRRRALTLSRWPLDRTTVVYSGIDPDEFPPRADTDRPWSWSLLGVGRVEVRKGFQVAVEALAQLPPEATFDVIGPPDRSFLEDLVRSAEELGVADRVRFLGPLPRAELGERYRAADAVLFPVLWDEPFGLVPVEAMASGTPVIATGTGGSGEFLAHDANTLLVPPGDPAALANAITRLAGDPALRAALFRGGRATAAALHIDTLADVLDDWHMAAAGRFTHGIPADRAPLLQPEVFAQRPASR